MPLLIQTGLEKFQFNRSRPISEPVCNQFPSVVSRSPYLSPSSSRASCREFMKRTILQKKKRKKTEREGKRTSTRTGDKNRRATCPPPSGEEAGSARRTRQNSKWKRDGSHSRERRKRSTRRRKLPSIVRPWTRSHRKGKTGSGITGWETRGGEEEWKKKRERERERKNGRSSNEEVGGRGDVNGSFPWDIPVFHGVPQDLSMVVFRVVLRYTVVRGGTTYTYGVGAARCERVHVDMHTSVRWNRRGNITSNPLPSLPASSPRDSLRRN